MSPIFGISEVLEFAVQIEKNGQFYYRQIADKFKTDKKIKDIFDFLAGEEVKHQQIFEEMLSHAESYKPAESYPEEYFAYLRAYANEHIFTDKRVGQKRLDEVKTRLDALQLGIEVEKDSILYYTEMKNLVPTYAQREIDKVIDQERGHYMKLVVLKNQK